MSAVRLPVRLERSTLRSFLVASLAVIALLVGGLALHTASGGHGAHPPAASAASAADAGEAPQHHATVRPATTVADTPQQPAAGAIVTVAAGLAETVSAAAVDHDWGADLLAACALLLALAGSVVLLLAGRVRHHRGSVGVFGDRRWGVSRRPGADTLHLRIHRPDLTVLSISRR
ncbi:hypothetical protein [Cryobacterium sp. SO1]|uniref:hypothetical protein n=1 Tax=Cryobacterium sp. SO1 TaxID=1897061 RepID=UPI001022F327|nr:hypothetical protein [Cryobacterium sp. SO1]